MWKVITALWKLNPQLADVKLATVEISASGDVHACVCVYFGCVCVCVCNNWRYILAMSSAWLFLSYLSIDRFYTMETNDVDSFIPAPKLNN